MCQNWFGKAPLDPVRIVAQTITDSLKGQETECSVVYDCHGPDQSRWFTARVKPIAGVPGMKVLVVHENITSLMQTRETVRRVDLVLTGLLKRRSRPLSDSELDKIGAACETLQQRLIVVTLIDLGLRVSELNCLTPGDFDWDAPSIRVTRPNDATGPATRWLPLTDRARALWQEYFAVKPRFQMSTRQIQRIVKSAGKTAGVSDRLSPQALRQTFAVRLVEKGATAELVNCAMGTGDANPEDRMTRLELTRLIRG